MLSFCINLFDVLSSIYTNIAYCFMSKRLKKYTSNLHTMRVFKAHRFLKLLNLLLLYVNCLLFLFLTDRTCIHIQLLLIEILQLLVIAHENFMCTQSSEQSGGSRTDEHRDAAGQLHQ